MALTITEGCRVMRKLDHVQLSCCKGYEAAQMFAEVGNVLYVEEMTAKKSSKCGEKGLFEHLLFLVSLDSCFYYFLIQI